MQISGFHLMIYLQIFDGIWNSSKIFISFFSVPIISLRSTRQSVISEIHIGQFAPARKVECSDLLEPIFR